MKIADVCLFEVTGLRDDPVTPPGDRLASALDIYPEFNTPGYPVFGSAATADSRADVARQVRCLYVEIRTDEGAIGLFGPIRTPQAFHIHHGLRPFLLGRDPQSHQALHDQMLRLDRHGRSGHFVTAISAVDCALWDLQGKVSGEPVYRLLGGPTRESVPAYASMLDFSVDPDRAAAIALEYRELGYTAQKWFFRHGPGDGERGLARNVALAACLREALGSDYTLMFDAFMAWDLPYAGRMAHELEPYAPRWLEEPLPPERVSDLRRLRLGTSVPIATGEHVYTRWQVRELLVNDAVDVLQTDPDWTGGISEQLSICSLGSAFGCPVIAHGNSLLPALHVAAARSPETVPMLEYLVRYQPREQLFLRRRLVPRDGQVPLPDGPGLGIELDDDRIEDRRELHW